VQAAQCHQCGHAYSTQFNQTQAFYGSPYQAPPPPHGYPVQVPGMIQVPPGSHPVVLVALLSLFIGGWAGMYVDKQVAKGLLFGLLGGIMFCTVTCGWGFFVWYPLVLVDAIIIANRLNQGQPVRDWQFF
jgi:hypothetical protein